MTNPDREELFTPDELAVRLDEWANCLDKSQMDLRSDMRCAAIHLRRLASSDSGVTGEPEPVAWRCFHCDEVFTDREAACDHFGIDCLTTPACQIAARDGGLVKLAREQEEELRRFRQEDTESYRQFYALGADHRQALIQEEQKGYDRGLADGRADTAPPADAGMREAFVRAIASLAAAISILERTPKAKKAVASDKMFDTMLEDYRKALEAGRIALTAPGATTKSDGGAKAGSSPILASKEYQRSDTHGMMPVGDNAANVGSTGVGPSDPSSTRSDVTVEELAATLCKACGKYWWQSEIHSAENARWIKAARALKAKYHMEGRE